MFTTACLRPNIRLDFMSPVPVGTEPHFCLDSIRGVVFNSGGEIDDRRLNIENLKADNDRQSLDYSMDDIALCLSGLRRCDFYRAYTYPNSSGRGQRELKYDAYVTQYKHPAQNSPDRLYIKFRLTAGPNLFLASFHLESWP